MPVRIYALAKELNLDSKDLVDLCAKAGVWGKGSALASLTDDEADKVKDFLRTGGRSAKKAVAEHAPETKTAPSKAAEMGVLRREDYIAPGGVSGKMAVLHEKPKKVVPVEAHELPGVVAEGGSVKPPPRSAPVVNLAPMPAAEQPATEVKKDEPAPQKPDLKLPAEAIRASKTGSRPLAEHLRRHEAKSRQVAKPAKQSEGVTARRGPAPSRPGEPSEETPLRGKGRRAKPGTPAEGAEAEREPKTILGGREQRQLNRKRSTRRGGSGEDDENRPRRPRRIRRTGTNTAAPRKGTINIELPCTVRGFSEATGVAARDVLRILLREGVIANITVELEPEMAEFVAAELGLAVEFKQAVSLEDQVLTRILEQEDDPQDLVQRPPVITFLGHVDHGKTSLLDCILGMDVASGERGGITQHIRAYEVAKNGHRIAFVDTPGHEAFTEMRARGANVTDIAVLVVAADDGVMPQTEEAISHARAADVPIVVALNKIDLPGVDVNRALQGLSTSGLLPSEWGGDVEVVKTSAVTREGIDELLETLLTVAELHDLKANPNRAAHGTTLEAHQEQGRGVVAKILVQAGTLRVGDIVVCGQAYGRIKAMYDTLRPHVKVSEAPPSTPVNMTGFDIAPAAGDHFYVLDDLSQAREIAQHRMAATRVGALAGARPHVTLENLFDRLGGEGEVATLNLILRADVRGSIEAIQNELAKLQHAEVQLKILQATVGGITEADVHLADASDAIIIGFNVVPEEGARGLADRCGVQVRRYDVIYKVTEDIRAALEGMLKPEEREVELGRVLVQQTFTISRVGTAAGCRVLSGTVQRNSRIRVVRNNTIIGDYSLSSLRREKDDVREVREGMECGMRLDGFNDLKEGDVLEAYRIEEFGRKFDE